MLFVLVRTRINALPGGSASLGPAVWLVLAGWILLFLSGCAYGCGRRCISSRGPRNADGGRGERAKMDYGYAEEARIEAIRAEEERKARQAHGGGNPSSHLPGFQPYETQPLTGGNKQPDQWLDEEDDVGTQPNNYRDHPQQQQHPSYPTRAGSDSGNSYARGGYAAGIGAGGAAAAGGAMAMGGGYRPNATRQPSDQYYAGGQSTPGGYPPVANDTGCEFGDQSDWRHLGPRLTLLPLFALRPADYHDPQADYQQNAYPPQQAQDPYYNNNAAPRSPQQTYADPQQQSYLDPYGAPIPHSVSSHSHAPSGPNVVGGGGGGWNQQQQAQQGYPPQSAPSPQQRYMSPSNAYGANTGGDPRQAMQNNFVRSPPPSQPITPGVNDAYATDPYSAYDAYDEPQPTPPSPANVYAPAPQRLPGQHPASLTPGFLGGGQHEPRDGSAGGHSTYYDASQQQRQQQTPGAGGSGGGGAAAGPSVPGVVEPPSYELSSLAPGQTDVRNGGGGGGGASSGYPREKGGYQPSTPGR